MKRFFSIFLILVLLMGTMTSAFAVQPPTPFNADEEIDIKVTGSPPAPAATIAFNAGGAYVKSGINYDFDLEVPFDEGPLVITLRGYEGSYVDYELGEAPYTGDPRQTYVIEIPRTVGPLGGSEQTTLDVKWFPESASSQEVMHADLNIVWLPQPLYSVTTVAEPPEGGTATGDVVDVPAGTEFSLLATPNSDWDFVGWGVETGPATIFENPLEGTVASTTFYTAYFRYNPPRLFSVTTDVQPTGGGTATGDVVDVIAGTEFSLLATPNPDWDFIGWGIEDADPTIFVNPLDGTVASTTYFTAHFRYNPPQGRYSVTTVAEPPEGGTTTGDVVGVALNTSFTLLATPNHGWDFVGWGVETGPATIFENPLEGTVASTTFYTAYFATSPTVYYTLDIDSIGPGYTVPSEGSHQYPSGAIVSLEVHPDGPEDFFYRWIGDDGTDVYYDSGYKILMNGNKSIIAEFDSEIDRVTLTIHIDGGGEVDADPGGLVTSSETITVTQGTTVYMIPDADSGWYFDEWDGPDQHYVDSEGSGEYSIYMDDDKEIEAVFKKRSSPPPVIIKYRLNISIQGSGSVEPFIGSQTYSPGTIVDVAALPAAGWEFEGWIGADGEDVVSGQIEMDENKSIVAKFVHEAPPIEPPEIEIPLVETPLGGDDLPDTGQALPLMSALAGLVLIGSGWKLKKKE